MIYIFLLIMSSWTFAGDGWKTIAVTKSCREDVTIEAKENEKYVLAIHRNKRRKLISKDGAPYKKINQKNLIFVSDTTQEKYQLGDPTFEFLLPSSVMSHTPGITVFLSGTFFKCDMTYKD